MCSSESMGGKSRARAALGATGVIETKSTTMTAAHDAHSGPETRQLAAAGVIGVNHAAGIYPTSSDANDDCQFGPRRTARSRTNERRVVFRKHDKSLSLVFG